MSTATAISALLLAIHSADAAPLTRLVARQLSATPTATSTTHTGEPFASESSTPTSSGVPLNYGHMTERSPLLSIITVVLIVAVLLSVAIGRVLYVRRYYDLTPRAIFIPAGGLHLGCITIRGPEARLVGPPPPYSGRGRRRRARRGRQVQGPDVAPDGARAGERDEDDAWDDEEDMQDRQPASREKDVLPGYFVDIDLPGYRHEDESEARNESALMTSQQYEAVTRRPRASTSGTTRVGHEGEMVEMQERGSCVVPPLDSAHASASPPSVISSPTTMSPDSSDLGEQTINESRDDTGERR